MASPSPSVGFGRSEPRRAGLQRDRRKGRRHARRRILLVKIMIAYPPIKTDKGVPLLSQNRQFQYFNNPTFIYPVVPATAASVLQHNGFDVVWADAIAERKTYDEFVEQLGREEPDIVAIESKTPTIKAYWHTIDDLKGKFPETTFVLMGDHVTACPEESLQNSRVDYVMTGGDFDVSLLSLAQHMSTGSTL